MRNGLSRLGGDDRRTRRAKSLTGAELLLNDSQTLVMLSKRKRLLEFGPYRLDVEEEVLLRDGKPVYLKPKVFETLLVFVENRGRILSKETLMQQLWGDTFVEEGNLTVNISQLRKALSQGGSGEDGSQFIETLPRRGYRFIGDVREVWTDDEAIVVREYTSSRITIEEHETGDAVSLRDPAPELCVLPPRLTLLERARARALGYRPRDVVAAIVLIVVVGIAVFLLMRQTKPGDRSQSMQLTRLTHTGKVWRAAISPDGKYVAYVTQEADKQSLWVRQVATAANVQIVPPAEALYWGLAFSRDGSHVYFVRAEGKIGTSIFEVAVLGGPITRLVESANSSFAVSPDGKQFAYVRNEEEQGESALIVANADGSGERTLVTRHAPDFFYSHWDGIAWSPDGRTIACHAGGNNADGFYRYVVAVQVEDGSEKPITTKRWKWISGLAWLADGSGLFLSASDQSAGWDARQIWQITYPDGEARRITNDLNGYMGLSLTSNAATVLTVQQTTASRMWIVQGSDARQVRPLTTGDSDGQDGMAWTPDGRIVYTSRASGRDDQHLWIVNADGSNQKPITTNSGVHEEPAVSADGRYIVYSSRQPGDLSANIWRIDIDGRNPKQLTRGGHDVRPQCSPDGKWVSYTHRVTPTAPTLWKVPLEGGAPVQLHDEFTFGNDISPDGMLIACGYRGQTSEWHNRIALLPFNGGPPVRMFDIPPRISPYDLIQWTPDGRALTYGGTNTTKIWLQPLDGSPARELIDFQFDSVWCFAWSPEGNQLAVARGSTVSDVVLISNFR